MFSFQTVIFIALIALLAGAGLCYLALNYFGKHQQLNKNLAEKLHQAEKSYSDYQTQVTEHFIETSKRVNNLTKNYKEVHEYLASSAMKLANPNLSHHILEEANSHLPGPGSIIEGKAAKGTTSANEELDVDEEFAENADDYEADDGDLDDFRSKLAADFGDKPYNEEKSDKK